MTVTSITAEPWWHGGVRGLEPGAKILPPTITGADRTFSGMAIPGAPGYSPDYVYVTRSRQFAALVAGGQAGAVYAVAPDGPLEPVVDGHRCRSATILAVAEPHVRPMPVPPFWVNEPRLQPVMLRVVIDGHTFPFNQESWPISEAIELEDGLSMPFADWQLALSNGSVRALAGFVWLVLRRNGQDVPLADILSGEYPIDEASISVELERES